MSESETTKGALLYQDVSTLLGDECGCGGAFLECNEDCCPTATVEGKEIKTYGGWLIADYICGKVPSGSDVAILQGMITQTTGQHRAEGSNKGLTECGLNLSLIHISEPTRPY